MKRATFILLLSATLGYAQNSKTPINNGILQSDLNAAGYKILSANLSDYAGTNLTWNAVTGKFDATGGGGSGSPGGSNRQFQYNSSSAFGGIPSMTYDGTIPATITLTPGINTRATGLQLQNTADPATGQQVSPSLHFISGVTGQGTYDTMLVSEGGYFKVITQVNGSGYAGSHSTVGWDNIGNFGQISGDANCTFATFYALDQIVMGNNSDVSSISTNEYGTIQIAGAPVGAASSRIVWTDGATYYANNRDTAFSRSEPGGVAVYTGWNSSTLGLLRVATQPPNDNSTKAATTAYADLAARPAAVTVATLPASPAIGRVAAVTDGTASLAWGATVTGGGSTKYLVWYNGANWTVAGK